MKERNVSKQAISQKNCQMKRLHRNLFLLRKGYDRFGKSIEQKQREQAKEIPKLKRQSVENLPETVITTHSLLITPPPDKDGFVDFKYAQQRKLKIKTKMETKESSLNTMSRGAIYAN